MRLHLLPGLAGALLLVACASRAAEPAEPAAPPVAKTGGDEAASEVKPPDQGKHMLASFWMAVYARDAIVSGDLPGAQQAAQHLLEQDPGQVPADWEPWYGRMRTQANELTMAPDLASAGLEVARLAVTCGDCHWKLRSGPSPDPAPDHALPTTGDEPLGTRMLRHQVASDEFWFGLIQPSQKEWQQGAKTLASAPLAPPFEAGEQVEGYMARENEQIRALAREARLADTHDKQAQVYGRFLASCASCHISIKR